MWGLTYKLEKKNEDLKLEDQKGLLEDMKNEYLGVKINKEDIQENDIRDHSIIT